MKNLKKFVAVILAILCFACILTSCSGNPQKKIIGTWTGKNEALGFQSDYSFTFNEDYTGSKTYLLDIGVSMKYTIDENELKITTAVLGFETTDTYTYSIKKDVLTLTQGDTTLVLTKQADN